MKRFITIATCVLICSIHPAAISTGQFEEVGLSRAPVEETVLPLTGKRFMVIDTPKLDPKEVYVLHSDGGEWAITLAASLGVTPTDPDRPDPPEPGTPLGQVRAAFGADVETFEQQRELMREALDLPPEMVSVDAINGWVQAGFKVAVANEADKWEAWLTWYHAGVETAAGSSADMIAWVGTAEESLQ